MCEILRVLVSQLLKAEMAEREVRSIAYQIKGARFPAYKDLPGFDFAASEVNEAPIRQLHRSEFVDGVGFVVLFGCPATGKSQIVTALGVQAVEHHRRKARFFATVDLVNALEQEKAMNTAGQLAERLLCLDLIILNELGYLLFSPSGGSLLLHLLSKPYERAKRRHHHQPQIQRVGRSVRRCQDDHRSARPVHRLRINWVTSATVAPGIIAFDTIRVLLSSLNRRRATPGPAFNTSIIRVPAAETERSPA